MLIAFGLYIIVGYGLFLITNESDIKTFDNKIKTELKSDSLHNIQADEMYSVSADLIGGTMHGISRRFGLFILLTCMPLLILIILLWYSMSYGSKIINNDLPSRFIKGKFTELKQKKIWYGVLPFTVLLMMLYFRWIRKPENSDMSFIELFRPFLYGMPVLIFFTLLWDVILGSLIVYRRANSVQDAFSIFGKKEVIQTCFEIVPVIPFIILMYLTMPVVTNILDLNNDKHIVSLRQQWISNEAVISLKDKNPDLYSAVNDKYLRLTDRTMIGSFSSWWVLFSKVVVWSFCALVPVYMLLQYFTGFVLYKLLKRKLET